MLIRSFSDRNLDALFLLWLPRVAADSKTLRSLRCHSGAAFFINNNTIHTLFYLFLVCLFSGVNKQTRTL